MIPSLNGTKVYMAYLHFDNFTWVAFILMGSSIKIQTDNEKIKNKKKGREHLNYKAAKKLIYQSSIGWDILVIIS